MGLSVASRTIPEAQSARMVTKSRIFLSPLFFTKTAASRDGLHSTASYATLTGQQAKWPAVPVWGCTKRG
jgi:hypothetical protein